MNDEQQAAQSIRKFVQLVKGLGELAPGLENLGSAKQAEQEVRSRISSLGIEENQIKNRVGQLKGEVAELEKKAEAAKGRAKSDADTEIKRAKSEGEKLLEKARIEAGSVMHKAQQSLAEIVAQTEIAQADLNDVNAAYKGAKQRLDQTNAELDRIVQRARG